ncbi:unnamed protein product [Haemonchus placei]|uniref:Uncharacterized protein n=1 Tax=Haemonchus placei TaxID=6290 RepID=A0A0N4WWE8_HAEPC|nr:unnamed protein product [Haemonchus placei]
MVEMVAKEMTTIIAPLTDRHGPRNAAAAAFDGGDDENVIEELGTQEGARAASNLYKEHQIEHTGDNDDFNPNRGMDRPALS